MTAAIVKYDEACRAIAAAKTFDDVADWIDKAAAVREYTRRIGNRQLEIDAIEIRVRAKRRRGELLLELKEKGQIRDGKPSSGDDGLTLADLGISRNDSAEDQAIARIEPNAFERLVARCREYTQDHPEKHSFNVLKPPPEQGPVKGSRAIMGSRVEPGDSLDFFPTPPWATRALIEHVMPQLGCRADLSKQVFWEPACGDGHIAEVLREYFSDGTASDIHQYGYGDVLDYLGPDAEGSDDDWIITNPPFGSKSEAFVFHALKQAKVGVAMFVRLQWLETVGRYERLFRDQPPTMIAFFCERVNLCKGRWDPDGDTATAYIWLVWVKNRTPRAPFWIPPGCRESLTRADDVERFTAKPVIKKEHPVDAKGAPVVHDDATGEVIDGCELAASGEGIAPPALTAAAAPATEDDLTLPDFLRRSEDNLAPFAKVPT